MPKESWRDERKRLMGILQEYELRKMTSLKEDESGVLGPGPHDGLDYVRQRIAELDALLKR
jgi:hypothetical protein